MNHSEILAFELQQRVLALVPRKRLPSCFQNCDKAPFTSRGRRKGSGAAIEIWPDRTWIGPYRVQTGTVVGGESRIRRLYPDALFSYLPCSVSLHGRFFSTAAPRALSPLKNPFNIYPDLIRSLDGDNSNESRWARLARRRIYENYKPTGRAQRPSKLQTAATT